MKTFTATLCLTLTILLGSMGMSASADFEKGLTLDKSGNYAIMLREWKNIENQYDAAS